MTLSDNESIKHIYIVKIIEDEGERIVFTTFNIERATSWCEKANNMIKKWHDYFDHKTPDEEEIVEWQLHEHLHTRYWQWREVRKAVIVELELRWS